MREPIVIEMYSRPGCHLCDEAKDVIERVAGRVPISLRVINVEDDPQLEAAFGTEIPVVFVNGHKAFMYRVDEAKLEKKVKKLWKT
jgi:glutaredoxin